MDSGAKNRTSAANAGSGAPIAVAVQSGARPGRQGYFLNPTLSIIFTVMV